VGWSCREKGTLCSADGAVKLGAGPPSGVLATGKVIHLALGLQMYHELVEGKNRVPVQGC
jgi:hypothetical protein